MRSVAPRLALVALVLVLLAAPARAEDVDCMACHGDPDLAGDGMKVLDPASITAGAHVKVACTDCHAAATADGFEQVPHRMDPDGPPACAECHDEFEEMQAEYEASVHAENLEAFGCTTCHDPHTMRGGWDRMPLEARREEANRACLRCHTGTVGEVVAKKRGDPPATFHGWLPEPDKHRRMRCIVCHTPLDGTDPHRILPGAQSIRSCESCHDVNAPLIRKFLGPDDRRSWVTHPLVFEEAYLPGAVRNRLVDTILVALFALAALFAVLHGVGRLVAGAKREPGPYEVERTYLHTAGVRFWHWTNAVLVLLLVVTGLRIHFGGRAAPLISFETAFNVHNLAGALLALLMLFFLVHNAVTGIWRQYLKSHPAVGQGVLRQTGWYLKGIFRGAPHPYHASPEHKFNPVQRIAYALVMYVAFPLIAISGLILFWPKILPEKVLGRPGPWWIATAHYLLASATILFLIAHLYLITTGDRVGSLLKSMITGWHERRT